MGEYASTESETEVQPRQIQIGTGMKQYAIEYWGFMTILAESEKEARAKFAAVDHGEDSDHAEIKTIDYMCEAPLRNL